MLKSANQLHGFTAMAADGEAGTVKDVYFDDHRWTVRYLVVETGGWFNSRRVLVSPRAVSQADRAGKMLVLDLSREQIKASPDIDTEKPVSRQHEMAYSDYYGYPYYWAGPMVWGPTAYPIFAGDMQSAAGQQAAGGEVRKREERERKEREQGDPRLRSSKEVVGYDIRATDDSVGHVEDFLIDDRDWSIRLMVVDTRNWWPGKKVLISPDRIDRVSWEDKQIAVRIARAEVEASPEYDPASLTPGASSGGLYRAGPLPYM